MWILNLLCRITAMWYDASLFSVIIRRCASIHKIYQVVYNNPNCQMNHHHFIHTIGSYHNRRQRSNVKCPNDRNASIDAIQDFAVHAPILSICCLIVCIILVLVTMPDPFPKPTAAHSASSTLLSIVIYQFKTRRGVIMNTALGPCHTISLIDSNFFSCIKL